MTMARSIKMALIATFAASVLTAAAGGAQARAAEPWWHMSVSSRPSTIKPGTAVSEVQEIKVEATGGDVLVIEPKSWEEYLSTFEFSRIKYAIFRYDATDQEVETALEGAYGPGYIKVTGGPKDEQGTNPYEVTFADRRENLMDLELATSANYFGGEPLEGKATATEKTRGRPDGEVVLLASNLGDAAAEGSTQPITVTDAVPPGMEAVGVEGSIPAHERGPVFCALATVSCEFTGTLPFYESIEVLVQVDAKKGAESGGKDTAIVAGGGAPSSVSGTLTIDYGEQETFGVQDYEMSAEAEGGGPVTQAGAHPFQLTTTLSLNQKGEAGEVKPVQLAKDLSFKLPTGLVGNPTAYPTCPTGTFLTKGLVEGYEQSTECPKDTAIGVAITQINVPGTGVEIGTEPLFNLEPERGEPARFGFTASGVPVMLDASVRTGEDYGVTVSVHNISQIDYFLSTQVVFWGTPGDTVHDPARGTECLDVNLGSTTLQECTPLGQQNPLAFLSMPTSCSGKSLVSAVEGDSWQRASFEPVTTPMPALVGCNRERFEPTIKATPDYEEASRPSGLSVDVHVPQELQTVATATAESAVKQIKVELPKGVTLNPGGAGGLQACSLEEVGFKGSNPEAVGGLEFTPSAPSCPKQSKIATAIIHTPLLPNPLEGAVYLATPDPLGTAELGENPFNSLIAAYLVAEDPISGTLVKLPMQVSLNEETGQVVTTVESPQLPFEDAELHFFGGGRAPLATPGLCGAYTTNAVFTPWSGQEPVTSTATFNITSGPNGSPCPSDPKPFTPEFNVGTTNNQAGEYSELRTTMGHPDEDQALGALKMTLPPGVSGMLSHVTLCPEPQAAEGTCGPESLIGHTTVTAGLGSTPAVVARPGNVYITGPYDGAPFGLSIANPAETGPFDLDKGTRCDCTVVRAKIEISPQTAQITVTTPPSGAQGAIPTMLDGIPLDLQHVSVQIDRPGFTFNPTNCEPLKITGTMSGAEGASFPISEPFQATNCASLAFKPKLAASTAAKSSKANGASLTVKLTYPKTPQGTEANIAKVKVDLPKQLPSRLTTLQKACVAKVFEANPANCPAASIVGHAKAITPILPVPLEGPAYFVSHGGEAFPSLIFVLQGYGVTEDLVGTTFISKAGITSSTFKSVPDVPVGTFELTLPQEPFSALAANLPAADRGSFCGQKLTLPTAFVGQNGAEIHTSTPLSVSGCGPELGIVRDSVKGTKATIVVSVPSAGRLLATGQGVSTGRGKAAKAGNVRVQVTLTKAEQAFLKKHPSRKLKAKINLRFTSTKGAKLTTSVTVLIA